MTATAATPGDIDVDVAMRTTDLGLSYSARPAFAGVSLALRRGTVTALVGPSGCGKSSFLSCLNRLYELVPGTTVSGSVTMDGVDVLGANIDVVRHRRRVGMIFQKPNPFPMSIRKNLDFPMREHGLRADERASRLEGALQEVGLWDEVKDRLDSAALALSGGQQQRLCIARALALSPEVVLLDEPCSALDPLSSGVVEDHVASLRGRYTVVVVTHNLAQARRLADHTAVFWARAGAGYIVEQGPTQVIFEDPQESVTRAYVGGVRG